MSFLPSKPARPLPTPRGSSRRSSSHRKTAKLEPCKIMLIAPLWALLNSAAEWLFLVPLLPFLQRRSGNENRPGFAVSRERPAKTLWRHGTDRLLFDRGAGAAGARGRTIRERRRSSSPARRRP